MSFKHGYIVLVVAFICCGTPRWLAADTTETVKKLPTVTVLPVALRPAPFPDEFARRVGAVIATMLEKAGVVDVEVSEQIFNPPQAVAPEALATAVGKHVASLKLGTEFAVFTRWVGTPKSGVDRIQTIVVDRSGEVLFVDAAGADSINKAKIRPRDPMTCCVFVSDRLVQFWKLNDPSRADAPSGKWAEFWRKDARAPDANELAAIERRTQKLRERRPNSNWTLYPIAITGATESLKTTRELAASFTHVGLGDVAVSTVVLDLSVAPHTNEQRVLWETARAFRKAIKLSPPTTDYAVYVDYGIHGRHVRYVHAVICDRHGEWVMIDMQNDHHDDFKRIAPSSATDCNRLLALRLDRLLRKQ